MCKGTVDEATEYLGCFCTVYDLGLNSQGKYDEAEAKYRQALPLCKKALGRLSTLPE